MMTEGRGCERGSMDRREFITVAVGAGAALTVGAAGRRVPIRSETYEDPGELVVVNGWVLRAGDLPRD